VLATKQEVLGHCRPGVRRQVLERTADADAVAAMTVVYSIAPAALSRCTTERSSMPSDRSRRKQCTPWPRWLMIVSTAIVGLAV